MYRKLTGDHVEALTLRGRSALAVDPVALEHLAFTAFQDISHFLRPSHLAQLRTILDDPEASSNDRYVALTLLKNANTAAGGVLPMCQDTGTAIVVGHKGEQVWTGGDDREALSRGIYRAYTETNLRYSQLAPLSMYEEVNTRTNLPAQIDLYADDGDAFEFLFIAKGGGSANKSFFYQAMPSVMRTGRLLEFLEEPIRSIGTAACPPYHLAVVIGGLSAEMTMKTLKLASCRELDDLPADGTEQGRAFRDREMEQAVLEMTRSFGIGAQFGGRYFCHDVRVIRLPRHGASLPIAVGVSCGADRQARAKITADGVFLEELERNPARFLPEVGDEVLEGEAVEIDLDRPMAEIRAELAKHPVRTRLSLSGPMVVARDMAHGMLKDHLEHEGALPDYIRNHPVYYAGPAKTPAGFATGSFGPTTAGRMDSYVDQFQAAGGSLVMLAKGNRSRAVVDACRAHGGFYLGSIGGPGAEFAARNIRQVECLAYEELGMEAVWRIEVEDFPAFVVIDDKGNDFFEEFGLT
ncbi:MAG: FumA C-terminus/TtdB family hydratase beta subunit [Rhodospirillales bacterium]|nr:FumA C-terminus/TtdB family hydratase beta subunit [Rhodospirillales bacterium]